MTKEFKKRFIKEIATQLGFNYCGIAKAEQLGDDATRLETWLKNGYHGSMQYMENYFDLRIDPTLLVPGAKSVITLLLNYYPATVQLQDTYKVAKYAYGKDYHDIISAKMQEFLQVLRGEFGDIAGRGFVDSAPVLERAWAQKSGLGWVGKNGNLLTREGGSFFFIATLITDLDIEPDDPFGKDYCGSCRKCIDACPTDAIHENKVVDGSKCISYFTIELKDLLIPTDVRGKFDHWLFGCDICQDVCPWNRFAAATNEISFSPLPEILNFSSREWETLSEDAFRKIFKDSAIKRTRWRGLKRNLDFLQQDGSPDQNA